ncbi:hypothetical protein [Chelativorans salis]|uniref:Uncharacterized protein n=1 Tax=Chelativorans salis TaxID=2978478 RepID=A0ABT2LXC7_9HYPH|nr:hypothetical protein [Chelativorans sp. EGI FJ00035]MCT7377839.1 hypothetical protein [Chelativorans sp. EGI FJ00035]
MALLSFRTRNPQRDRDTDRGRIDRLLQFLRQLHAEIDAERSGLEARYEKAQTSAAFALEAFENGGGEELASKADNLTVTMQRYHARVAALEKQIAFVEGAEMEARAFHDALSGVDPEKREGGTGSTSSGNVAQPAHD